MNKSHLFGAACASLLFTSASFNAEAITVLSDSFNSGSLDSAWQVSLSGNTATGWTHTVTTSLNVFAVDDSTPNTNEWAYVTLTQTFSELSDFDVSFDFTWDNSTGDQRAMDTVGIRLFDGSGSTVVKSEYRDAWIGAYGQRAFDIGGATLSTGADSEIAMRGVNSDISRLNGFTTIDWNGVQQHSGSISSPIAGVDIIFGFNWNQGPTGSLGDDSYFSTARVNAIQVNGTLAAVPLPTATWLFGSGLLGLIGIARRKKTA